VVAPLALLIEPLRVDWTLEFFLAMGWSVLGLSLVSIMLLLYLIRRGQVSRAASLTYLVPPAVAIESWILFGEVLTVPMIIGTVIVVIGVWLTNRKTRVVVTRIVQPDQKSVGTPPSCLRLATKASSSSEMASSSAGAS
jgi:drug/metabolite transporter (DMT)-like permease